VPFGGAGPLHGAELAALLGMRTIVVPPSPGVLSTFGLLCTDVRNDYSRTHLVKPPDYDLAAVAEIYQDLEREAEAWLDAEGVPQGQRRRRRLADVRYRHQGFEITVPWEERDLPMDAVIRRFHERHRQLYTYALPDAPVEIVTLRVAAAGRVRRFCLPALGRRAARIRRGETYRRVYFSGRGWVNCSIVDRDTLGPGAILTGPVIVEQLDSTTVVNHGQRARVDGFGNLIVSLGEAQRGDGRKTKTGRKR